jgi:FAD/FMN-containing dehydrogenase
LTGRLVLPTDATYPVDKQLYNQEFDDSAPDAIAYCSSPTDVQRCLEFARRHDVALAARSGGHSYGGYSTCSGLVIDVSSMSAVAVDPANQTAVVGAGTKLLAMYETLGSSGVLVPGGSCPTVGIAGLTLGGGIGVFARRYGLTCDNVASLEIVTADGRVLECSPEHNADLYWACRGGGGGNFGVVTSFTFRTHPMPAITLFTLEWPFSAAADVLGSWLAWIGGTPDELWSNCQLLSSGSAGGLTLRVTGVFAGTPSECSAALAPMLAAVGAGPSYQFVGPETYQRAMLIEAGCENETVDQCLAAPRAAFAAGSAYLGAPLPSAGIDAVVASVTSLDNDQPSVGGGFVFDSYGGVVNRVPADATAFVHRSALSGVEFSVNWGPGAPESVTAPARQWLSSARSLLSPYATGAYQNYIDPAQPEWLHAYYGSNLSRLASVKRAVDPDDVFRFAQSIPVHL